MKKLTAAIALGSLAFAISACDVEQTEEAELPEVNATGGEMPAYDVDTADVDVGTQTETIEVPDIEVEEADAGKQ
jgi:hypothetical protein